MEFQDTNFKIVISISKILPGEKQTKKDKIGRGLT